jgi:hypothetical protein
MRARDYLRFDAIEDVLSSLDLLALVAGLVRKQPSYWKWMIVAAHGGLQGAMVCALNDTSGVSVLDNKSARKTLKWYDARKGTMPQGRLADFKSLLARCQDKSRMEDEPLVLTKEQLKDLRRLHEEFRNNFSHFTPMSWSIEIAGLPRIVGTAVDCIEYLMGCTQALIKLTGNRKRRLSKNIKETRALLAML